MKAPGVVLVLPYPVSSNRYWNTRVIKTKATGKWMAMTYVTPEAKAYKDEVRWCAKAAGVRAPIKGRVEITYALYPHRPLDWQRRMKRDPIGWDDTVQCIDLGNAEKVMSDALNGVVIDDDCWVRRIVGERMEPDDKPARLVVTIAPFVRVSPQPALPLAGNDSAPAPQSRN